MSPWVDPEMWLHCVSIFHVCNLPPFSVFFSFSFTVCFYSKGHSSFRVTALPMFCMDWVFFFGRTKMDELCARGGSQERQWKEQKMRWWWFDYGSASRGEKLNEIWKWKGSENLNLRRWGVSFDYRNHVNQWRCNNKIELPRHAALEEDVGIAMNVVVVDADAFKETNVILQSL